MPSPVAVFSKDKPEQVAATCREYGLSVEQFHDLFRQSVAAAGTAYCPYSNFPVGAALLTGPDGLIIRGANVENAAYPVGTCAERVALGHAVVEGHRQFKAVAVVALATDEPCSPCGMCRQFIREFCSLSTPIIMFAKNGNYSTVKLELLLPLSFGPESLPRTGAAHPL